MSPKVSEAQSPGVLAWSIEVLKACMAELINSYAVWIDPEVQGCVELLVDGERNRPEFESSFVERIETAAKEVLVRETDETVVNDQLAVITIKRPIFEDRLYSE